MVQQAAAIQRVRQIVRDPRRGRVRGGAARNGLRSAQIAELDGEADAVGHQILELLELFGVTAERISQHGQRLRLGTIMLTLHAASERQGGNKPVAAKLRSVGSGGGQVAPRRGDLATMEPDNGGVPRSKHAAPGSFKL